MDQRRPYQRRALQSNIRQDMGTWICHHSRNYTSSGALYDQTPPLSASSRRIRGKRKTIRDNVNQTRNRE